MKNGVGQPVTRKEDPKFLMGRGRYVDDIDLPDLAYGFVLRSIHANAKIKSIDTKEAKALPGVIGILTGDDYASDGLGVILRKLTLICLKVRLFNIPMLHSCGNM